ncbi:MAG: LamG-like jellyroll fold domain-containing protein, partial [Planctomycetota bacterium]|jgi:hypothetical protein
VWSFTVEPLGYPIEGVTATSNADSHPGAGPENTVNGSGLNADDQHSTESADMFLGSPGADPIYLQYEFDRVYKLHQMLVWNYNVQFELLLGFGVKDTTIEYSENGADWTVLGDVTLNQATASPDYEANTTVDFGGVAAQFVKLTVNSGFGMMGQFGLSEVRFLFIPAQAREPQPEDGAADVSVDAMLAWRAGREAVSHEVHLSTDPNALALIDTTSETTVDPGTLDLGTTYYWQVDEVNEADEISVWTGSVWTFTTQAFFVVDDFESYDDEENRIYDTWLDGFVNGTGATVGYFEAPFAEQTIVNSGRQSMPLFYDNAGVATSEADLDLAQDWTASGIRSLAIAFAGAVGNGGQLYVKINGVKVAYDGDAGDIASVSWLAWNIDLSTVGGNLSSVTSLTIGIEGAGAAGVVYIDDIRLYPQAPEYYTPTDPGNTNLAGHWDFDEGAGAVAADVSGNGHDGTIVNATWQAGQIGSALKFDGMTAYADIPAAAWTTIDQQATVAVWMYVDSSVTQNPFTFAAFQNPAAGNTRVMSVHVLWGDTLYLDTGGDATGYDRISKPAQSGDYADAWIHWAFTKNAETGEQKIYRNGILWHSGTGLTRAMTGVTAFILGANAAATGDFWNGAMDDFRLYNKELSPEEILWLAGRSTPVAKPF